MRSALIITLLLTASMSASSSAVELTANEKVAFENCQTGMADGSIQADDVSCKAIFQKVAGNSCLFKQIAEGGSSDKAGPEKLGSKETGKSRFSGSQLLLYCQQIIGASWKGVGKTSKTEQHLLQSFKSGDQYQAITAVNTDMVDYYNDKYNEINAIATGCNDKKPVLKRVLKRTVDMINNAQANLLQCMALAAISSQLDAINFEDEDHIKKGETSSVDGKIKCTTEGVETQDFPACKHFTYTYSTFLVGQKGVETVQQIGYTSKSMDREEDLAKTSSGTIKKSLELQRDSLSDQKGMAEQNAAFHGAKGTALLVAYNRIPDPGAATEKCKQVLTTEIMKDIKNAATSSFEAFKKSIPIEGNLTTANDMGGSEIRVADYSNSDPCKEVAENGTTFMNQKAKQAMMEMMMQAGVDMLANAGKSMLLNKQIGQVDRAIQGLNEYTASVTIPTFATATATADYCNVNVSDPACADITSRRTYDLSTGGITIGGVGSQTTADQVAAITASDTTGGGTVDRTGITPPTGSLVDNVIKSSGLEKTIGAASLKDAAPGGGGGGGGGGVGSVAAPNSGGGGGGDGSGSGGGSGTGLGKMAYGGGAGHTYSGGLGSAAKKTQNATNPLEGLFNKQGPKASGDVLDFRGVASINDKDKDLFKLISNRYETVTKSKRLMEYEAVPKQP